MYGKVIRAERSDGIDIVVCPYPHGIEACHLVVIYGLKLLVRVPGYAGSRVLVR